MYPPLELEQDLDIIGAEPPMEDTAPEDEIVPENDIEKEDKDALKTIIFDFESKEQPTRERMLRFFRKCELFWDGVQDIIWDDVAHDFKSVREIVDTTDSRLDPYYYNKIINIFRSYGEAVIAALTPEIPTIVFPPDDADVIEDVNASKGYTRLSELISKHNSVELLLCKSIFTLWNQGLVGCYVYVKTSKNYGVYNKPVVENVPQRVQKPVCLVCGSPNIQKNPETQQFECPNCGSVQPQTDFVEEQTEVQSIVGYEEIPKARVCLEIYGPNDFEIPHYVKDPADTPYVSLKTDAHVSHAKEIYGEMVENISGSPEDESDDRWAREPTVYNSDEDDELVTIRRVWLRNWAFNCLKENKPEIYARLKQKYPNGVKVELVDDQVARCTAENMDDFWSFTKSPLSNHLHSLPIGAPLIPLQEIRNELLLLKLQHVEYGIPETFADPHSLNFKTYNKQRSAPGMIYPAKAMPGKALDQSFTTLKTAQYPQEINQFQAEIDADAQFVVGAFPTIYGGALPGGGKTASEYNMSRNQALQRLGVTWKYITRWWAESMSKAVVLYHENMLEDEKYVQKNGDRFETVWIRKSELTGKIGQVEPEVNSQFPISQAQKRDLLIQLLQMNNEAINMAVFMHENATIVQELLGFPEFDIPGATSRNKQLEEIQELLMSEPLDPQGMQPSVPIDPQMDDHQIEFETTQSWMRSDVGRDAKVNNPAGYANVRAHGMQHQFMAMQLMQVQAEQEQEEKKPASQPKTKERDSREPEE